MILSNIGPCSPVGNVDLFLMWFSGDSIGRLQEAQGKRMKYEKVG